MKLSETTVTVGGWVVIETDGPVRGFPTVTIGDVTQTALVEADTRLKVTCPDLPAGRWPVAVYGHRIRTTLRIIG